MVSIFFNWPFSNCTLIPTFSNAAVYFVNVVSSSKVSPKFNDSKRAKIVLNALPTVSALWRVCATTVAKAAVAYS